MKVDHRDVIVVGAGGHSRVVIDALIQAGHRVRGAVDPNLRAGERIVDDVIVLGGDNVLDKGSPHEIALANGVGSMGVPADRQRVFDTFSARGFEFVTLCHPSAIISANVTLGEGVQIMAGAIIQPGAIIGRNAIVNTGAQVDHDSQIGGHTHVAPNATICGSVTIGTGVHVGAGATVIQNLTIGDGACIGAGALVIDNCATGHTLGGVPAKVLK